MDKIGQHWPHLFPSITRLQACHLSKGTDGHRLPRSPAGRAFIKWILNLRPILVFRGEAFVRCWMLNVYLTILMSIPHSLSSSIVPNLERTKQKDGSGESSNLQNYQKIKKS